MKTPALIIKQICSPSLPVFAVFRREAEGGDVAHLLLEPCPVMGLIEVEGEPPFLAGLADSWGFFDCAESGNGFCGYAYSLADAEAKFGDGEVHVRWPKGWKSPASS